jgi:hypothetical protein
MPDLNQDQLKIKAAKFLQHFQKLLSRVSEIIVLIAFTVVAYTFLLYFAKYLWVIFTATHVGQTYAEIYRESYRITNDVLNRGIISLAINLALTSCVLCLIVGTIFKFLHIIQYFYSARGFFGRIIFTGLPLTYIVAIYMHYKGDFSHMDTAFTVALVPTLCIFAGCFRFAEEFVPDLFDVINILKGKRRIISSLQIKKEDLHKADESIFKENTKRNIADKQTKLHAKYDLSAIDIMIIFFIITTIIAGAGVVFIIYQTQLLSKMEKTIEIPAVTETNQKPAQFKKDFYSDGRFNAYPNKTVHDTKTGLMWAAEESETMDWHQAKIYCKNYRGGGYSDWRMPTINELEGLYDSNKQPDCGCITNLIEMYNGTNCWEWSSEAKASDAAFFAFNLNGKQWLSQSNNSNVHIRPVRYYK